jgi:hypothetical protein
MKIKSHLKVNLYGEPLKNIHALLRRIPFTLIMLGGLILTALITNTYFDQITHHWLNRTGFAPNDLWYGNIERMFTSALVTLGGVVFWEALFFVIFAVGLAERLTGWKRTAATFWGVHLLALLLLSLIISLGIHQLRDFGLEAAEVARDVGPSAGYFACLGLVSAQLKRPWSWVSGGLLFAIFLINLFIPAAAVENAQIKFSADLAHLLAFPLGWFSSLLGSKRL